LKAAFLPLFMDSRLEFQLREKNWDRPLLTRPIRRVLADTITPGLASSQ